MAVVTPPLYQAIDATYSADDLGLPFRDLIGPGIVGADDLEVTERGAGANLSVDVAAGSAWVRGTDSATQPTYRCRNDATVNLAIAAADATDDRLDLVVAEVRDAAFSGVSTDWRLRVVTGTPAGSPSAPATPDNALVLATVSVPATDTTIANAQITDNRVRAQVGRDLVSVPLVTALPSDPYDGQTVDYLADASTGVTWRLRYREAEAGSYKWYFVGGAPLYDLGADSGVISNTSYVTVSTAFTLPLDGDYYVDLGARAFNTAAGSFIVISFTDNVVAADDADWVAWSNPSGEHTQPVHSSRRLHKTGMVGGRTWAVQAKVGSNTGSVQNPTIMATPIRVG